MLNKSFALLFIALVFVTLLFTNCNNSTKTVSVITDTIPKIPASELGIAGSFSAQTKIKFDSTIIKTFLDSFPKFKNFEKDITGFYHARDYAYAWFDEKGIIENAIN